MNLSTTITQRNRLDPRARDIIGAIQQADEQALEDVVRTAINAFVVGCRADGIYDQMKAWRFLAGPRTINGLIKAGGGADPTNVNFVSGDYTRATGLLGNGSNKQWDSQRLGSADASDNHHHSCFVSSVNTITTLFSHNYTGGVQGSTVRGLTMLSSNQQHGFVSDSTNVRFFGTTPAATGFMGFARTGTAATFRNDSVSYSSSESGTSAPTNNIHVFSRGNIRHVNARIAFYSIGENLDLALLDARVSAYMTAIAGI
jgi:hypothetical protein